MEASESGSSCLALTGCSSRLLLLQVLACGAEHRRAVPLPAGQPHLPRLLLAGAALRLQDGRSVRLAGLCLAGMDTVHVTRAHNATLHTAPCGALVHRLP